MLRSTFFAALTVIMVVVPLALAEEGTPAGVKLEVSGWEKSAVVEGYWNGDAKIVFPVDAIIEPEVVQSLLRRVVEEAVGQLPFAVEDWIMTVQFFKGEERHGWTHISGYNAWQSSVEKLSHELAQGMHGGCEARFQVKHQTYLEQGAPVEVTYECCRYGSTPKARALLGELSPPQPQPQAGPPPSVSPQAQQHILVSFLLICVTVLVVALVFSALAGSTL